MDALKLLVVFDSAFKQLSQEREELIESIAHHKDRLFVEESRLEELDPIHSVFLWLRDTVENNECPSREEVNLSVLFDTKIPDLTNPQELRSAAKASSRKASVNATGAESQCPHCSLRFSNERVLGFHLLEQHSSESRPYHGVSKVISVSVEPDGEGAPDFSGVVCSICGRSFRNPGALGSHRLKKHGIPGLSSTKRGVSDV